MRAFLRWSFRLFLFALVLWGGGFLWFTLTLPKQSPTQVSEADGIVVLTGGRGRLQIALDLLAQGKGQRLLISGVNVEISDQLLKDALAIGTQNSDLDTVGVTSGDPITLSPATYDCCVDTGRAALDTQGNAIEIAQWAGTLSYEKLLVVTGAYHMPRSMVELQQVAPDLDFIAYPVFTPNVKLERWWAYEGTARMLAGEYNKYVASLVRARLMGTALEMTDA